MNKLKSTLATLVSTLAISSAIAQNQEQDSILALSDFDGDGKSEYLIQRTIDNTYTRLYLQDASNSALNYNPKSIITNPDLHNATKKILFEVMDIGYDGDLDIYGTIDFDETRYLHFAYINDGTGNFTFKNKTFAKKIK